jgi:hypothetical protein
MKRLIIVAALGFFFCLTLVGGTAYSQATFKIPFKFRADGKPYPPGTYWFAQKEEGTISFRRETGEEEVLIPYIERLTLPDQPVEEPQLVFDMVGNFEPSYTEYITEYVLAEVWLTEKEGFLILSTERSEYKKSVKGEKAEK